MSEDPRVLEALHYLRDGLQLLAEIQADAIQRNEHAQRSETRLTDVEVSLKELSDRFSMFLEQYTHALAERELGG